MATMDLGIKGKAALILAASKGLGKACAMSLAREGCAVAIVARGEAELATTRDEIAPADGRHGIGLGGRRARPRRMPNASYIPCKNNSGRSDILVNNAGGPHNAHAFAGLSDEDWSAAINLNLMSAVRF